MGFFDTLKSGAKEVGKFAGDVAIDVLKKNIHLYSDEKVIEGYERGLAHINKWDFNDRIHEVYEKEMKKRRLI